MVGFIADVEMPVKWPRPPDQLSFSTFREIETCPLRWGLANARYGADWCRGGRYPQKPNHAAICGSVTHRVVEELVREVAKNEAQDVMASLGEVLREKGGLSTLIESTLDDLLQSLEGNPRADPLVRQFRQNTATLPSNIGARIQLTLHSLAKLSFPSKNRSESDTTHTQVGRKGALAPGVYSEITLHSGQKWFGRLDLLFVSENEIRIEEIKSGKPKSEDEKQIKVYAWLWWSDKIRNPNQVPAKHLTVRYPNQTKSVGSLSESELNEFGASLLERSSALLTAIERGEFSANPHQETCRYCQFRQLCDRYWAEVVSTQKTNARTVDLEASFVSFVSPRTWKVQVAKGPPFDSGEDILLRGNLPTVNNFTGRRLRIIDAVPIQLNHGESGQTRFAQVGSRTEIFVVG